MTEMVEAGVLSERRPVELTALVETATATTKARAKATVLAQEHAALRRVAELVARESSSQEIFQAVTEEAARVFDTEAVGLLRCESDGTATLVAQSQTPWDPPLGTRLTLDGDNVIVQVARTRQAARVDDWADATGAVAAMGRRARRAFQRRHAGHCCGADLGSDDRRHESSRADARRR
jgi:GAF domain-containing protein